ncbi:hypothetical protein ENHYD8BJ_90138 [Enhydrobacter sp. 8BJ]|nr:hypothetical protein ENHYD8BJ_90138 [Enhydrobacter sp. 8BJ]
MLKMSKSKTEGDRYSHREIKWQKVIEPIFLLVMLSTPY